MSLDPALLSVVADPLDHGPLTPIRGDGLYNPRRDLTYVSRNGVPVLIADDGRSGEPEPASFDGVATWYDALMQDPAGHAPLTTLVNERVATELGPGSGLVLDVACGTGLLPRWLVPLGYSLLGLDYSADQLSIAATRLPVVQGDAAALPFRDGSFTAVVTTFSAAPDLAGSAREAARVLAPGGRYVVAFVHPALNGSLTRRHADGSVTVSPGYHGKESVPADLHSTSVRGRVGAVHHPLDARLTAILDAGLRLGWFEEVGEDPTAAPTTILTSWTKP